MRPVLRLRRSHFFRSASLVAVGATVLFVVSGIGPQLTSAVGPTLVTIHSAASLRPSPDSILPPGGNFTTYLGDPERTSSASSEELLNVTNAASLHLLWANESVGVWSQPVIQDGIAYYGAQNGCEYAVYVTNGTSFWSHPACLGEDEDHDACGATGITSTSTVVGDKLYVDGGSPDLYALNSSTGAVEWSAPIGGTDAQGYYDWASPLIYNNEAYIGISSGCDDPLVPAGVAAYSLNSHHQVDYFNTSVPQENGSSIWGSVSVNPLSNTIFFATGNAYPAPAVPPAYSSYDDSVIALNASTFALQAQWQVPPEEVTVDGDFGVTPTVFTPAGGLPMVTAADKNGILYAFYQTNLTIAWQHLICCRTPTGGVKADEHISTSYGGGLVYAIGPATTIGGVLYNSSATAIDPRTGAIVWQDGFNQTSYDGYAAPTWANNVLIVPDGSTLILLNSSTGAILREAGVEGIILAAASISRGEIFVGTTSGVFAFDTLLTSSATQSRTNGRPPFSDSFSVQATGGVPPYTYFWTFGTGATSTLQDPSYTYTQNGTYNVTVAVTDFAGNVSYDHLNNMVGTRGSYDVTFTETGLLSSTSWSVGIDGIQRYSTADHVIVDIPNGTYAYAVGSIPGFAVTPANGSVTVNGAALHSSIRFSVTYLIAFVESGLPAGTLWSATLAGTEQYSTGSQILFSEPNGTYSYSVSTLAGYSVSPAAGSLTISGSDVSRPVRISSDVYAVDFVEKGLPKGSTWYARVNGYTQSSNSTSINFTELNGTYKYQVYSVPGFTSSLSHGVVTVDGKPTTFSIVYSPVTYVISFVETGLPKGTKWNVTIGSVTMNSTTTKIEISEPNGTFAFEIAAKGYTAISNPPSPLTVNGANVNVTVTFTKS